jgi:23S rRNA pseudouridine2604 synthase
MNDISNANRLSKRVAELVPCSRSEAERYIVGGWVRVDGSVVEDPSTRVEEVQHIALDPGARPDEIPPVTLLLHRPAGVVEPVGCITRESWFQSEPGQPRFLKRHLHRLTETTPLDPEASGLVVLTQDLNVVRKLVGEGPFMEQEYNVEVAGEICENGLALLNHGLAFNGKQIPPMKVSWQSENRLRFALKGVQPGLLSHMCQSVNLRVVSLKRIRIGRVPLARLPVGQWRYRHERARF